MIPTMASGRYGVRAAAFNGLEYIATADVVRGLRELASPEKDELSRHLAANALARADLNGSMPLILEVVSGLAAGECAIAALTNATFPYAMTLANKGWKDACKQDHALALGLNVVKGKTVGRELRPKPGINTDEQRKILFGQTAAVVR